MTPRISVGDRIPQAALGRVVNGVVEHIMLNELLAKKRAVIVGVPGAFTPVCTCEHVPELVSNADKLKSNGMDHVICIAPDNPWVVDAWAGDVDPARKVLFLSDGNLLLARALGVNILDQEHCLGEVSARYMMMTSGGIVRRLNVEQRITDLTCTRPREDLVLLD